MTAKPNSQRLAPRSPRVTINHQFASVEELLREYVSNVSSTGVFIRSDEPVPVGTLVRLRFSVLARDIETVCGVGEVVRVSHEPRGMGVVFVDLDVESEQIVERLLEEWRSR